MRTARACGLAAALGLLAPPVPAQEGAPDFVQKVADRLELGEPLVTEQAILFPLLLADAPEDVGVDASGDVEFAEPEKPARKFNVLVRNKGTRPALVQGGLVLEGGLRDRLVANDTIVGPGAEAEVRALPASSAADQRKEAVAFRVSPSFAPLYLRRKAEFDSSESLVPTFVARWIDFIDEGDERNSLAAIHDSTELAEYTLRAREDAKGLPEGMQGKTVVGGIGAIRGRIQMLTVYGTNGLVDANFDALARGAMFASAAIEIRSKAAGVPLPGKGDPQKTLAAVKEAALQLLDKLRKAKLEVVPPEKGAIGETVELRLPGGARGRAVGLGGKLVHLGIYPNDPVESRLYASTVDPDKKPDPEEQEPVSEEEEEFVEGHRKFEKGYVPRRGGGGRRR
jgi:hypothetical protein